MIIFQQYIFILLVGTYWKEYGFHNKNIKKPKLLDSIELR